MSPSFLEKKYIPRDVVSNMREMTVEKLWKLFLSALSPPGISIMIAKNKGSTTQFFLSEIPSPFENQKGNAETHT